MNKRLLWISVAAFIVLAVGILALMGMDEREHLPGLTAGGFISAGSFFVLSILLALLQRKGFPKPFVLLLLLAKLTFVCGLSAWLLLTNQVSMIGFASGFSVVPVAIALESLFGPKMVS